MKTSSSRAKRSPAISDSPAVSFFAGIVIGFVILLVCWLGTGLEYLFNSFIIDLIDPASIQWYHWFFWDSSFSNAALYVFYPTTWWALTAVVSFISGIAIAFGVENVK